MSQALIQQIEYMILKISDNYKELTLTVASALRIARQAQKVPTQWTPRFPKTRVTVL